ncbi:hypothetical protein [Nocardia sp. NBC_00403]|uniref:hypothetical protein n=1 Tax=Nocardia sp. NBC_00403 TaxID=2975990 RepID=UPI002E233700
MARATISRRTCYALFDSTAACFTAVFETVVEIVLEHASGAGIASIRRADSPDRGDGLSEGVHPGRLVVAMPDEAQA